MARAVANPFVNTDLKIPEACWDAVRSLTSTFRDEGGERADIDSSPFRRYVDLWWLGLCIGVRRGVRTTPERWHTFTPGVVLSSDPWRILHLELLAVQTLGRESLAEPGKVIGMANDYAAAGLDELLGQLRGVAEPIWALTTFIKTELATAADH